MTVIAVGLSCVSAGSSDGTPLLSDGQYEVGDDLPAGEYYVKCNSYNLYIEVSSDSSGDLSSVIYNLNTEGGVYITVEDGEYLKIQGGDLYKLSDSPDRGDDRGYYKDGMYKVGEDIPAGDYEVESTKDQGYIEITKNSRHQVEDIITNDNFKTSKDVKLEDGQYIFLRNGAQIDIGDTSKDTQSDTKTDSSSAKGEKVTVSGADFNVPEGFKEDPSYSMDKFDMKIGDSEMKLSAKTFVKGDDVICCGVAKYPGHEVTDDIVKEVGSKALTINGVDGYEYNGDDYDGFIYAKDGNMVIITASDMDLINDVVIK
ncbi:hypothetical protein [Methanobrevibacter sp.]|uniref:hypothetical protein n=1 Tax=Methanobrevibacter sp. TaxID=66852 RepID=UPI0038692DA2